MLALQEIANDFEGSFALKNAERKYFYANQTWLKTVKLESPHLMGKTDDELFPPEHADFFKKTDLEALGSKELLQYVNTTVIHGQKITYIALKWVIRHKTGEVFCYCTLGDLLEHKQRVIEVQPKIQKLLENHICSLELEDTPSNQPNGSVDVF